MACCFPAPSQTARQDGNPCRAAWCEGGPCLRKAKGAPAVRVLRLRSAQDDNRSWGWVVAFPPFRKLRDRMGHPFRAARREKQIFHFVQDDKLWRAGLLLSILWLSLHCVQGSLRMTNYL